MRAIILAGGKGTRLRPYTISIPKPLVPVGDKPILERIIEQLRNCGFSHITIAVNYLSDVIMAYFSDGSKWGVKIDYSIENMELGTMGPLNLIKDLPNNFLVMNGDVLTDLDYHELFQFHVSKSSTFTICSSICKTKVDFGVLDSNSDNELVGFQEKPILTHRVSMGIYIVNTDALKFITENMNFGFDNLVVSLINSGILPKIYDFHGYWLDIGRPSDYEQALIDINGL